MAATAQAIVKGALAVTLADVTMAATAQAIVKGALAVTLGDAVLAAAAQALVKGALAVTLNDVTLSATGSNVSNPGNAAPAPLKQRILSVGQLLNG